MTQQIIHLYGSDGQCLVVRGEDPAEIYRLAVEYVAGEDPDGWLEVSDQAEDIKVTRIRAVPSCCWPCGCGEPNPHYTPSFRGGRGSFLGAFVAIHQVTTDEMERRRAEAAHV